MRFSSGVILTRKGQVAASKLERLRDKMFEQNKSLGIGNYYKWRETLLKSPLFDCLSQMPKPVVHHAHVTACATLKLLVMLTYYDFVFYSEKENKFFASKKGCDLEGYVKVNSLRQYAKSAVEFDEELMEKMKLNPPTDVIEDHKVWEGFQYKFMLTNDLYNYEPFFEKILYKVCKNYLKEMVTVLEIRHIFGMIFDDDHKPIPLEKEIEIFHRVQLTI